MIKVKIRKKGRKLDRIKQSLRKLDGEAVELGYFASQGRHPEGPYSYAALAQALEMGYFPVEGRMYVPMPFMKFIVRNTLRAMKNSPAVKKAYRIWGKRLVKGTGPEVWLKAIGELAIEESGDVFNNRQYFPQAPNNKTPIYETGALASQFTYRITTNMQVRRR